MTDPSHAQASIDAAMLAGDTLSEAALRNQRVGELLLSGLFLERGTGGPLIEDLSRLRELADPGTEWHAHITLHLAFVVYKLDRGDPAKNQNRAIRLATEVLDTYTETAHPEEWAQTMTTLGTFFNEREVGNEQEDLQTAEDYLRAALRVRSPKKDAVGWAYTASNLAEVLARSSSFADSADELARLHESTDLSRRSAAVFEKNAEHDIAAQCSINGCLAMLKSVSVMRRRRLTKVIREEGLDTAVLGASLTTPDASSSVDPVSLTLQFANLADRNPRAFGESSTPAWARRLNELAQPSAEERALLDEARERATEVHAHPGASLSRSRASQLLGDAAVMYDNSPADAAYFFQRALEEVGNSYAPRFEAEVAEAAGQAWSVQEEWGKAASAYLSAIGAFEEIFRTKTEEGEREFELFRFPKIVEMAAYALARTGQLEEAVRVLEQGRARNLTWKLLSLEPDLTRLESGDINFDTSSLREQLGRARLGDRAALDALRHEYKTIQRESGLSGFGQAADSSAIAAASTAAAPLVYLLATPAGSVSLLVTPDQDDLTVELLGDNGASSAVLVTHLNTWDAQNHVMTGLQSGDVGNLDRSLNSFTEDLGTICKPVLDRLLELGSSDVVFVAAGMLGSAPLAAALVDYRGTPKRLIDFLTVRMTPSAGSYAALIRRRARREQTGLFVGLGDAERSVAGRELRWAEVELRASAISYQSSIIAVGSDADTTAVTEAASASEAVHFACHGAASDSNPWLSSIQLADGPWTAATIWTDVVLDSSPTVILSSCESAQFGMGIAEPNEYIGLAASLLSAGASSVVCSLAQVNDYATSVLMVKFHELLREGGRPNDVAAALRGAQLWYRDAPLEEVEELAKSRGLEGSTDYRAIFGRRRAAGTERQDLRALSHWAQFLAIV